MPLSHSELNNIHLNKRATPNARYYGDDDKIYIGTLDKRLRLLDNSNIIPYNNLTIPTNNVSGGIDYVNNKLTQRTKEVEISFGNSLYKNQFVLNIIDSDITENNKITASLAYKKSSNKDLDELEMDEILFKCKANNGSIDVLATSLFGSIYGNYILNYTINY